MNIVVLAGGYSTEREVSLTSGALVANALVRSGHRVAMVDPYLGLPADADIPALFGQAEYHHTVSTDVPDLDALRAASGNGEALIGPGVIEACRAADVTFLALHGGVGEDGRLQSLLDCYGICYTGTNALGAALSMDKEVTKCILAAAGIATPRGTVTVPANEPDAVARLLLEVGLPCVVKPATGGSSVGVFMVDSQEQLAAALAAGVGEKLIVEQRIVGRELTVGVLDGRALPPIEIIPKSGFYDYKNKYQAGLTLELCPAPLTEEQTARLQDITCRAFAALHLTAYARLDYIMDAAGKIWCLEANALPGMTPTSLLPQMAEAIGMDYDTLCETIVRLALKK